MSIESKNEANKYVKVLVLTPPFTEMTQSVIDTIADDCRRRIGKTKDEVEVKYYFGFQGDGMTVDDLKTIREDLFNPNFIKEASYNKLGEIFRECEDGLSNEEIFEKCCKYKEGKGVKDAPLLLVVWLINETSPKAFTDYILNGTEIPGKFNMCVLDWNELLEKTENKDVFLVERDYETKYMKPEGDKQ